MNSLFDGFVNRAASCSHEKLTVVKQEGRAHSTSDTLDAHTIEMRLSRRLCDGYEVEEQGPNPKDGRVTADWFLRPRRYGPFFFFPCRILI